MLSSDPQDRLVQKYLTFNVKFLNFWTPENFGHSLVHSLEPGDAE